MIEKNKHAKALGKMGKGKPKNFSPEELEKRIERLRLAREKRWSKPVESSEPISAVSASPEQENESGEGCRERETGNWELVRKEKTR